MKILICPDSFKETLSSIEACQAIYEGILDLCPKNTDIRTHPIADGGEGMLECIKSTCNLRIVGTDVLDPLGRQIKAEFGILKDSIGIVEMAKSSGLCLLNKAYRDPFLTSTYGVGQMIKKCLDLNLKKIIIGIGGSSTNDAGIGMAQALGVKFWDDNNKEIEFRKKEGYCAKSIECLDKIDVSNLDPRIKNTEIIVCSDVSNKLLGENGASFVYGKQKGAKDKDLPILNKLLAQFRDITKKDLNIDLSEIISGGAAGGLGAGLSGFLNAEIKPGLNLLAELTGLIEMMKNADIVITGEGKMDNQTKFDKAPYAILKLAKKYDKKVFALNGFLESATSEFDGVYGTNNLATFDAKNVKQNAYKLLKELAEKFAKEQLKNGHRNK